MKKKAVSTNGDVNNKVDQLKKQMFEIRLAKSISGVFDKKKMRELKNQVIQLYSSEK